MTREPQIDREARGLWQVLKGDDPPDGLHGSDLLAALIFGADIPDYERLHSPYLRDSQISLRRKGPE
ncbi:MAG: hypothetical protein KA744_17640 [Phenylobacterium sp.]|nr:hypothetical protein [Phenylobacterium sp.]